MTTDSTASPEEEQTLPPVSTLRYATLTDLFQSMPQVKELIRGRPLEEEEPISFLYRLRASTTPEDAVTFTAFAVQPKMAIWWGYECLRSVPQVLSASDRELMEGVATWATQPTNQSKYMVMQSALFAPIASPAVLLGLSVGWSGGPMAPNDPFPVPAYRAPRAINSAVLSCLARVDLSHRPKRLARFIELSESLFRAF